MASECTERKRDREKPAVRDVVFRVGATVAIRRQLTGGWIRSFYAMVIFSCFMRERMCVCVLRHELCPVLAMWKQFLFYFLMIAYVNNEHITCKSLYLYIYLYVATTQNELRNKNIKFYNVDQVEYEGVLGETNGHTHRYDTSETLEH